MPVQVPPTYDPRKDTELDPNELFIRDGLKLDIDSWARFRYAIHVGNRASNLSSTSAGPVSPQVAESYRELAKSHYEVITSLGCARLSLDLARNAAPHLMFKKSAKDFYFHLGCLLDNIARLVYIINDAHAASAADKCGRLKRHRVDWGTLGPYAGYARIKRSPHLKQIVNIRNAFTHGWGCPYLIRGNTLFWPVAVRNRRDYLWPYDESSQMRRTYRAWRPAFDMMTDDLAFVQQLQNRVFKRLTKDARRFERTHHVTIR
jgi:hypothetical protein